MSSSAADLIDDELRTFLLGPVSILLATADRLHTPDATRVAGIAPISDSSVRILVSTEATAARSNTTVGARCALLATDITTYRSVQWKGTVAVASHERTAGDLALMHRHVSAFEAGSLQVRMPACITAKLFAFDVVALELELQSRFDQTPGPGAGRREL